MKEWILTALGAAAGMVLAARLLLHYFQLESYQFAGYFRTLGRQWKRAFLPGVTLTLAAFIGMAALSLLFGGKDVQWLVNLLLGLMVAGVGFLFHRRAVKTPQKKKFALTARMKRLYAVLSLLCLLLMLLPAVLSRRVDFDRLTFARMMLVSFVPFLLPMALLPCVVALSALIAQPMEKSINRMYMRDAQRRMDAQPDLIRIGITGSYGKTSVKNILYTILSQKYNVLSTPASFNTPMGLTRVIRERLEPAHQIFLAEMGARHRKDIKELTDFIHPVIGVLTSVGPQHLDTFKTLENIIDTKYDLIRALPREGFAVFNDDGGICAGLYEKTFSVPKAIVGRAGGDAWAEDVQVSAQGSSFTLRFGDGGSVQCHTRMLGAHNISNILLCCAVAKHLGLTDSQIQRGIGQLQPVEHRLQLLPSAGGVTVIDDAFNSNPAGAKAALDVLSKFPGRRIIVTPGMVELGGQEAEFNRQFGQQMAASADVCVLIGKRHTQPIREGLEAAGYPAADIHVFSSLDEATAWLRGFMRAGDFVLYENDLPDHYSES